MKRNAVIMEKKKLFCSPKSPIISLSINLILSVALIIFFIVKFLNEVKNSGFFFNVAFVLLILFLVRVFFKSFLQILRFIEFATLDENGITFSNVFRKIKIVKWTEITSVGLIPLAIDEYHGRWESVAIFVQIKTEEIEVSREQRSWAGNRKKFQVSFFKASAKNFTIFRKFFGHYCPKLRINGGNRYMNAIE